MAVCFLLPFISSSATRAPSQALEGQTVSGSKYVIAKPDTGTQARFWIDDQAMVGSPRQVGTARPFDTRTIANGSHTVTAIADLAGGGTRLLNGTFTVTNP